MSEQQQQNTVLIAGAGIAGPVLAFWLSRAGISSLVVERSSAFRRAGQIIDIRGAGLKVVRRMGLDEVIRSKITHEEGVRMVDASGKICAQLAASEPGSHQGFTAEIEIPRSDLCEIFYEASLEEGRAEYVFGDHVTGLVEEMDAVKVTFEKRTETVFDLVIMADGQNSHTRGLAFGKPQVRSLGQYISYFSIPKAESDSTWSKCYHAPGGRVIMTRPDNVGLTRAYLAIVSDSPRGFEALSTASQKDLVHKLFDDAGWELPRILKGMDTSEDFYMQEVAQIKMAAWFTGRMALLGDAGYCPSPLSGMGTTLAIVGAYILAGEIARHRGDHGAAFAAYEALMRPFVDKAQKLPPGVPGIACPQTSWGIAVFRALVGFVAWSGLAGLAQRLSGPEADGIVVPEYEM